MGSCLIKALVSYIWGLCCQKQIYQTGISNYISQSTMRCNYLYLPDISASGNKVLICHHLFVSWYHYDGISLFSSCYCDIICLLNHIIMASSFWALWYNLVVTSWHQIFIMSCHYDIRWFKLYYYETSILHMPRQHSCHVIYNIILQSLN